MTIGQDYPSRQDRTINRDGKWGWIALAIAIAAIVAGFAAYPMGNWRNTAVQTGISVTSSTTDSANAAPDRRAPSIMKAQSLNTQEQSIQVGN
jgi:anti-sigma-K factor RskA